MWNKLSQAAGLTSGEIEDEEKSEKTAVLERSQREEHIQQQEHLINHLKELVRENEKHFQDKTKECDELSSKFQKFKLQSKAKIAHLSSQIKEQEKTAKKEDCDFDDTSSSDSSDQFRRGKVLLLKKQLEQVKQQLDKKVEEVKKLADGYERRINDLELQLNEKNILISSLADTESKASEKFPDKSPKKESSVQEMYAQIVYKDSKIMDLNNQILEHEKQIMDLQEHVREKDEVLQQRNRAVQLMAEDMTRKGKSVINDLDETREQMKIMQENFSSTENDWKVQLEKYTLRISELENEISEWDKKLKSSEALAKNIENARYELTIKNAELQKKIVFVQESAAKQCELYNKEIGGDVETLKKSLEAEKQHSLELQKALDEMSSQSDNKVLKARVKERTKLKALERELNELKKANQEKPSELLELQQRVAELEEEKGSLQLKLMDIEDSIIQLEKVKEENEALHKNAAENLTKIQYFEKQVDEFQLERESWEAKVETLNESYKESNVKFNTSTREKFELQEKLTNLMTSKEKIETDYNVLKQEYNNLQSMYNEISVTSEQIKDQKVTFELKNIELEEIRESDEKAKKDLLAKIEELKESFNDESKPYIQLEKENFGLKDKLKDLTDKCTELEIKNSDLLSLISSLQREIVNDQNEHSVKVNELINNLNAIEIKYEEVSKNLETKMQECTEKEKAVKDLENNLSQIQNELENVFSCFEAKDVTDCKNYAIQKTEDYILLKSDYEKLIDEKDNLLFSVKEKSEDLQNSDFKIEKLEHLLEKRDIELKSLESVLEGLQETISQKDVYIVDISTELEEKRSAENLLAEKILEKSELLMKSEEYQKYLNDEVQSLKNSQLAYLDRVKANNLSLLGQITDLETELANLREDLSYKEKVIEDLNEKGSNLQRANQDILMKLKEKENIILEKETVIENFESVLKGLQETISQKDAHIVDISTELEEKRSAENLLAEKILEKSQLLMKSEEYQKYLNDEVQSLKDSQLAYQDRVKANNLSLLGQITDLETELANLRKDLSYKEKVIEDLNEKGSNLQRANQDILMKLKEKENIILEKETVIENFESELRSNKDSFSSLEATIKALQDTIADKDSGISTLIQKLEQLDNITKTKDTNLSKISEELQKTIQSLESKEADLKLIKERNIFLEEEKLHSNLSLTEKDEVHQQILTEKLHLEADLVKLQDKNKALSISLKEKVDELDLLDTTINQINNLMEESESGVQDYLKQLLNSNNKLASLAEKYFYMLADNQNVINENSNLRKQLLEMQFSVEKLQQGMNDTNFGVDKLKKECEELTDKNRMLENNLQLTYDLKCGFEDQISEFQAKIQHLNEENNLLKDNINSPQDGYVFQISYLNNKILLCETELKNALGQIQNLHDENKEITELHSSLETSLKNHELKKEEEFRFLSERAKSLEDEIVELNQENGTNKQEIESLKNKVTEINLIFDEEKSTSDKTHKNLISDLQKHVIELETKIVQCQNEKHLNESSTSDLQALVSEKELQISTLNSELCVLDEKLSTLQTRFNQEQDEHETYKNSMEKKLQCLQNCKQHYCMVLSAVTSSQQIVANFSFIESDISNVESVDEFTKESKSIAENIVKHLSEIQSLNAGYNSMENNLKHLQTENTNLSSQCETLKTNLLELTKVLQNNLKLNDSKFEVILSAVSVKENIIADTTSKILTLNDVFGLQKHRISSLESDLHSNLKQLQTTQESLSNSEKVIKTLTEEKEEMGRNTNAVTQRYEEKLSHLDTTFQEVTSNCNSLQKMLELKQMDLEKCLQEVDKLKNDLTAKEEDIARLQGEQEHSNNNFATIQSELTNANISISSLQNEIRQLNKQISEHTLESHYVEASNNVSNGLQVEVEDLKRELASCKEENISLKQHIDNTNLQLQSLLSEKSNLESIIEQMQHNLNDLIETKFNLSKSLEEFKTSLTNNEKRMKESEEQYLKYLSMYERTCEELEKLKAEKTEFELKERNNLQNKISLLDENCNGLKNFVEKVSSFLLKSKDLEFDLTSVITNLQDESMIKFILKLHANFIETRKNQIKEIIDLQNQMGILECKNNELSEELGKYQERFQKYQDTGGDETEVITIVPSPDLSHTLHTELLQQQTSLLPTHSAESFVSLENDNKSLKLEVNEYKIKFAKVLSKLKIFKDKNEKLNSELNELRDKNSELMTINSSFLKTEEDLQNKVTCLQEEKDKLFMQLKLNDKQKQVELDISNDTISQLKERSSLLDKECCRIRKELQDYKHTWEQSNVSYELQKEDNERLRNKLKEISEQTEVLKSSLSEMKMELVQSKNENFHLRQEVENLREHANMLLSDNDTYQTLIEKLTKSKTSLEQKLSELKDKYNLELQSLQSKQEDYLRKLDCEPKQTADVLNAKAAQEEFNALKIQCSEMQQCTKTLEQERDTCIRKQNLLEKEKFYLQQQLLEKVEEVEIFKNKLDDLVKNETPLLKSPNDTNPNYPSFQAHIPESLSDENSHLKLKELLEENSSFKYQIDVLTQELNVTRDNFHLLQKDCCLNENNYKDKINQLEIQLQGMSESTVNSSFLENNAGKLESELQQALTSLHNQGLRCEELSLEVSKLLEERNILRWKLQQYGQQSTGSKGESDTYDSASSSELTSVRVETPTSNADVVSLHARLVESEKTCQQLHQANEALDRALVNERDQKRIIEEELVYAKARITEEAKSSDEYHILLGDVNEPEYFTETNFSISRHVKTHTHKLRRWFRGRRNYLWRTVKSRNYPQLVYIFYIFLIHVWLLTCVFS